MGSDPTMSRLPAAPTGAPLRRAAIALLALGLVGCDHATKAMAEVSLGPLPGRALGLAFGGKVGLRLTSNPDVAFSLLGRLGVPHGPGFLVALALLVTVALAGVWWARARRGEATSTDHVGFALVLAGAAGNALDRAVRGHVVDFLQVGPWPVFNVADVVVVVGLGLLGLSAARAALRGRTTGNARDPLRRT